MFFVHTALVLMWSLDRRPHILDFYIRRIFRIYPLAIFAVLCALLVRPREAATLAPFTHPGAHHNHRQLPAH